MKRGDTQTRVGSNLSAIMWKGKRNVNTLTNTFSTSRGWFLFWARKISETGHYHPLWLEIIKRTIQVDVCEGSNTRYGRGESNSDHTASKTSPIHQPTKQTWRKTTNTSAWKGRELDAVRVRYKQSNNKEIQVSKMQHKVVSYAMLRGISHQTAFLNTSWQ